MRKSLSNVCVFGASKYGKMYHVMTVGNFSTFRMYFKNFSAKRKIEHVH